MAKQFKKGGHREIEKKEFAEEVLQIDRVTRVVKGGRRLRFRVTVAIGNKKGKVGIGIGKASEVVTAIQKAVTSAKKMLIFVPTTKGDTIPHEIRIKHKAARMLILPASPGTGVIAGGTLRKILELAGVQNVLSKNFGTNNRVVTSQAAIKALSTLRPVRERDKPVQAPTEKTPQDSSPAPEKAPKSHDKAPVAKVQQEAVDSE